MSTCSQLENELKECIQEMEELIPYIPSSSDVVPEILADLDESNHEEMPDTIVDLNESVSFKI